MKKEHLENALFFVLNVNLRITACSYIFAFRLVFF